jgi:hypothetical protein
MFTSISNLRADGKRLIAYMRSQGYKVSDLNIVYLEDASADSWAPVNGRIDYWDDVRIVVSKDGDVLLSCEATTEPGSYYTYNPMNPKGAFRIAFGQYLAAWELGDHKGQPALIQCGALKGYRDFNQDGIRTGDALDIGDYFGVDQHSTSHNYTPDAIGRWSAGCLVGRYYETHIHKFLPLCKEMGVDKFDSTIIPADKFAKFV